MPRLDTAGAQPRAMAFDQQGAQALHDIAVDLDEFDRRIARTKVRTPPPEYPIEVRNHAAEILVAPAAPGGTEPAFRVLRNEAALVNGVPSVGVFVETLKPLIVAVRDATGDPFDGASLAIGDLDGDDALDFVVTRSAGPGLATRAIRIDK